jgi:hypothetical protein
MSPAVAGKICAAETRRGGGCARAKDGRARGSFCEGTGRKYGDNAAERAETRGDICALCFSARVFVSVAVQLVFLEIGWCRALRWRPGKQLVFCPLLFKTRIVPLRAIVLLILMALF